jgi:hypothetical protein
MTRWLLAGCVPALLGTAAFCVQQPDPQPAAPQACALDVVSSRPLVLSDGRAVHVATRAAAGSRGQILIAGTPVTTWRADTVIVSDTLVGVIIRDTSGVVIPVPNPLRDGRVATSPRVAPAREGGWHVVFIDSTHHGPGTSGSLIDSATVWYGRFDGARWNDLERVGLFRHTHLYVQYSPDLGVDGDQLRFAFTFDKVFATQSNAHGNQGVIMLRRDRGRWFADTLHTKLGGTYVRLAKRLRRDGWDVGVVQGYFDAGRVQPSSMFVTTYDSVWHEPRLVAKGEPTPISRAGLSAVGNSLLATWVRRTGGIVEWARVPDGVAQPVTFARLFENTPDYGTVVLDSATLLWHARIVGMRDSIRTVMYRGGRVTEFPRLAVKNESFNQHSVAMSPTDIAIFTSRLGRTPVEPTAQTLISRLTLSCPPGL